MTPARFDLLQEPWIPVRYVDGSTSEVSVRSAFRDASTIRGIDGELPTQTFALTRLLLAILYRASYDEENDRWHDDWALWWNEGLPTEDIDDYLDEFAERFDLFHPERPFFQVPDLRTGSGETKDTAPLVFDLPSNNRLFTTRSGAESLRLPFAEAARWLVNAQAFDASGIKSGAVGDDRVKGGRGYPIGVSWSGLLGGVLVEGDTLQETLLLNFALPGVDIDAEGRLDLPPWEDDAPDTAAVRHALAPTGPVRLFTWQSRRIRLVTDGERVTGCVLANGDALTPQNQQNHEPMTGWRYSEPQSKKAGVTTYMPREHQPDRAFWRGIGGLLPSRAETQMIRDAKKNPHQRFRAPAVLESAERRIDTLGSGRRVRVRAIGVIYGSNNSVIDEIIDDRITLALTLLSRERPALAAIAESAVSLADQGVRVLRYLAENLARAAGGDGEGPRERAEATAYAHFDGMYREWLAGLDDSTDTEKAIMAWRDDAHRLLRRLGADLVSNASPAAWAGREVQGELLNTPRAEGRFLRALHKTFAIEDPSSEGQDEKPEEGNIA
ncbi:CRISPR system Cascade subunit CasA [Microbacterium resistens]|uniref:CRISPR system Cascade subunit CasA n=1 Tax=Microbacterium resistens TaxID=156977 RepID=A0ABU1SBY4_9MICO|nr:type I-E CRISPR-associated protein Cse1/CasA [Microbacterium resistens]MDR6867121.1 CRISPR system Cascade subunit CasA [Microbacterium resistens]